MRCPDCNKFVGFEVQEPEESSSPEAQNNGQSATIEAEYTIDRNCDQCGRCLSQGTIGVSQDVDFDADAGDHEGHNITINDSDVSLYEDSDPATKQVPIKRGPDKGKTRTIRVPYRYRRSYIGVQLTGTVHCEDDGKDLVAFDVIEKIGASEFEEQV